MKQIISIFTVIALSSTVLFADDFKPYKKQHKQSKQVQKKQQAKQKKNTKQVTKTTKKVVTKNDKKVTKSVTKKVTFTTNENSAPKKKQHSVNHKKHGHKKQSVSTHKKHNNGTVVTHKTVYKKNHTDVSPNRTTVYKQNHGSSKSPVVYNESNGYHNGHRKHRKRHVAHHRTYSGYCTDCNREEVTYNHVHHASFNGTTNTITYCCMPYAKQQELERVHGSCHYSYHKVRVLTHKNWTSELIHALIHAQSYNQYASSLYE